jgi:hypothetical protein
MNRTLILLLGAGFVIPAVVTGYMLWVDHSLGDRFELIHRGDSESQVLARLGSPHRVTGAPVSVGWDTDGAATKNHGECVKEFWYDPPSISGDAYTVGFDSQGHAVSKYRYLSP